MKHILLTLSLLAYLPMSAQLVKNTKNFRGSLDVAAGPCLLDSHPCKVSISASMTYGYQPNPYLFVGAGLNVNSHLRHYDRPVIYFPFYADFKVNFTKSRVSPYLDLRCGYSLLERSSLYLDPSLGISYRLSGNQSLSFAVSCTMQMDTSPTDGIGYSNDCCNLMFRLSYGF